MILRNAYVVTMDDAGTEHERGWVSFDVAPRCPTAPPFSFAVSPLVAEYGDPTSVIFTVTITNTSPYPLYLDLEELDLAPGYDGGWAPADLGGLSRFGALTLGAGESRTADEHIGGIYEWSGAQVRATAFLPVGCQVIP